jgi:hypothetical protein
MGYDDYSRHQQGIIKRYYRNLDGIQVTRLAELTTELYLAEGKKRDRLWKQALELLAKLEVPASRIEHIDSRRDPALLATLLQEVERQAGS